METIKTSENVEFDVIYADGTRKRVPEGVLFGVENERIILHNGTSRPEVMISAAEAGCEVIGNMKLPEHLLGAVIKRALQNMKAKPADHPETNEDRIRGISMLQGEDFLEAVLTIESLAERYCKILPECQAALEGKGQITDEMCKACLRSWLQKEVEVQHE